MRAITVPKSLCLGQTIVVLDAASFKTKIGDKVKVSSHDIWLAWMSLVTNDLRRQNAQSKQLIQHPAVQNW